MKIGNRELDTEHNTYVCGILNITPDSFSDGGRFYRADPAQTLDAALAQTERMITEGADLIDIGGESTRPGYTRISDEEEMERVMPVIEAVKRRFDIPVSLDTYKSAVAREGLLRGADLINDIWGLKADAQMARIIAKAGVPCCLMHNREQPYGEEADGPAGGREPGADFVQAWLDDISGSLMLAGEAGIAPDRIILDPGVGFGKTYAQSLAVIRSLDYLVAMGYPVLLGASRKSVIGLTLDVPADDRVIGTAVTTVFAVLAGCAFVRVHDVKENVQAVRMTRAILENR